MDDDDDSGIPAHPKVGDDRARAIANGSHDQPMSPPDRSGSLKIRDSQMRSLSRARLQQFVVEMMTHLCAHFPIELAALRDWELCEELERCLDRAAEYGISSGRDCARYLELATCFGWSFDTELGWPAELLREPTGSPSALLARVHERCLQSLEQAATKATYRHVLGV